MAKELRSVEIVEVEQCEVRPAAAAGDSSISSLVAQTQTASHQNQIIPLTFFDIPWLLFPAAQSLFFYPYPYPSSHFLTSTLPTLKQSLSLALQHFFPFAARLVFDSISSHPNIVYPTNRPYVSLTFARSVIADDHYFHHLSANGPRHVKDFHSLVPWLQQSSDYLDHDLGLPLLAVKVTLFPHSGLCLGLAYHHVAADGRTFNNFIKTWASFHRDSSFFISSMQMPSYDRTVVIDKHGLEPIFLAQWSKAKSAGLMANNNNKGRGSPFQDMVRATFMMGLTDMEKIKRWIIGECKTKNLAEPLHLSPYVLTCAFVWVCLVKALTNGDDNYDDKLQDDEHPCYFGFNAGGLNRLQYPVPATYLGNCVGFGRAEATRGQLLGENGIILGAKAIGGTVKKLDKSLLGEAQRWISDWEVFVGKGKESAGAGAGGGLHVLVTGSPKLDLYETDFGWGRPNKIEEISIDGWDHRERGAICLSLTESRDEKGGIEVGLALPNSQIHAFTSLFHQTLQHLTNYY